ncbi:MAG: EF-hand domain-containing protein, partial [Pseudomonadota bacterium]
VPPAPPETAPQPIPTEPGANADTSKDDGATTDLVRLPGQGELKVQRPRLNRKDRLAPGGGLLLSFDADANGAVTTEEFETGLTTAFATADGNGDGQLTVFEQLDWAESLPTRDGSLANPVRFDPNLDRMVSYAEFSAVIRNLAAPYRSEIDGSVDLASLKRPEAIDRENADQRPRPGGAGERQRPRDPRSPRSNTR